MYICNTALKAFKSLLTLFKSAIYCEYKQNLNSYEGENRVKIDSQKMTAKSIIRPIGVI